MKLRKFPIMLAILAVASAAEAGGDPEAGKAKADAVCASCHGETGISISSAFPNLAGQYESYLLAALKQYVNGQRNNAIMLSFAAQLSEQEMKDLAAFYARQQGLDTLERD